MATLAVANVAATQPPLSEAEAIALAEQFVVANGYTDLPADLAKLQPELRDRGPKEKIAARRHGTLQRGAWGVARERRGGRPGWTVAFQVTSSRAELLTPSYDVEGSRPHPRRPTGRAVTMDANGDNIRIEHADIFLDMVKRVPRH